MKRIYLLFLIVTMLGFDSCSKNQLNPEIRAAVIRININPNFTFYQQLNTVGGWVYVKNGDQGVFISGESRGVIIYRLSVNTFKAYDRIPPNSPNQCGDTTKLIVGNNYPFVKDPCTGNLYQLLDGSLFKGTGRYALVQYHADYDGTLLHVFN